MVASKLIQAPGAHALQLRVRITVTEGSFLVIDRALLFSFFSFLSSQNTCTLEMPVLLLYPTFGVCYFCRGWRRFFHFFPALCVTCATGVSTKTHERMSTSRSLQFALAEPCVRIISIALSACPQPAENLGGQFFLSRRGGAFFPFFFFFLIPTVVRVMGPVRFAARNHRIQFERKKKLREARFAPMRRRPALFFFLFFFCVLGGGLPDVLGSCVDSTADVVTLNRFFYADSHPVEPKFRTDAFLL